MPVYALITEVDGEAGTITVEGDYLSLGVKDTRFRIFAPPGTETRGPLAGTLQDYQVSALSSRCLYGGYRTESPLAGRLQYFMPNPPSQTEAAFSDASAAYTSQFNTWRTSNSFGAAPVPPDINDYVIRRQGKLNFTGLQYTLHRHYDPFLMRFTSPDPIAADFKNLNAYVGNNPNRFFDPDGLHPDANALFKKHAGAFIDGAAWGIANVFTLGLYFDEDDHVAMYQQAHRDKTATAFTSGVVTGTVVYGAATAWATGGASTVSAASTGLTALRTAAAIRTVASTALVAQTAYTGFEAGTALGDVAINGKEWTTDTTLKVGLFGATMVGGVAGRMFGMRTSGPALARQNMAREFTRFRGQGFSRRQAYHLAQPYNGMGHHFVPRRTGLPNTIIESPINVLKPSGISRGAFYELHYKVDPKFFGTAFPSKVGGVWKGEHLGLTRAGLIGRLWHGSPGPLKYALAGAGGAGAAGTYWALTD